MNRKDQVMTEWFVNHTVKAEDFDEFTEDLDEEDFMLEDREIKKFNLPILDLDIELREERLIVFPSAFNYMEYTRYSNSSKKLVIG